MSNAQRIDAQGPVKYDEADLKAIVLTKLLSEKVADRKSFISNEFKLGPERRADIALFNGTDFIGVEVKSDFDNLKRLEGQHSAYSKVFDRIIVVVAERHLSRIVYDHCERADLWSVSPFGQVRLIREAQEAPIASKTALADLLQKSDLAKLVGMERGSRITRAALYSMLEEIDVESVRAAVVRSFNGRFEISSRRFFKNVTGVEVMPRHLTRLSRFEQQRKNIRIHQRHNEQFWKEWAKVADEVFAVSD